MRIALLAPAPPFRGGIVTHTACLCRTLEERGHSVFWSSLRKQYPNWLFPGTDQKAEAPPKLAYENVPQMVPWSPLSWRRTANDLVAAKPDVLVFPYWMPFFAPALWAVLRRVRTRMTVISLLHNVVPHEKQPLTRPLTKLALAQAHGFIAQSEQVRHDLCDVLPGVDPSSVIVVPHPLYDFGEPGVEPRTLAEARSELGLSQEARVILFFGFIKPYKGVDYLIKAGARLKNHYGSDGVRVLIVGDVYGDRAALRESVRKGGAADIITLVDRFVPDSEVEDYFLAADLVVLPYVSATQSGIVKIAWNYNRPVVTTAVGGLPEVVRDGETGFVVPSSDAEALAGAMIRFFDEERAEAFGAAIKSEKEKYSWHTLAKAIEDQSEVVR